MKISAKLKVLAAAVGLLAAGGASAATATFQPSTGNSSLILTVFDTSKSYVSGVGSLRLNTLTPGTYSLAGLSSLFAGFNPTTTFWGVTAFDNSPDSGAQFLGTRMLTTTSAQGSAYLTQALQGVNGTLASGAGTNFQAFDTVNCGTFTAGNACTATSAGDTSYAGGASWGADFGSTGILSGDFLSNATTLALWGIAPDPAQDDFTLTFTPPVFSATNFTVSLDLAAGTVTVANAVPVPAAVWLLGSALGGMGFFRRRKA